MKGGPPSSEFGAEPSVRRSRRADEDGKRAAHQHDDQGRLSYRVNDIETPAKLVEPSRRRRPRSHAPSTKERR